MSFEPLGYRFEVRSLLSPAEVKSALRAKKNRWLEIKDGPRGWILGSLMCLWLSAFNRQGPMIIARIRSDGFETRIVGRAGADLNGTLMFIALVPILAAIVFAMHEAGQGSARTYLVIALVFGLGLPFTLWINHKDRRRADPLVRFIQRAVGMPNHADASSRPRPVLDRTEIPAARLTVNGDTLATAPSEYSVAATIENMEPNDFAVLEFGPETYMQAALGYDRFTLEKREGSADRHFRAKEDVERGTLIDLMTAYLSGKASDQTVEWKAVRV